MRGDKLYLAESIVISAVNHKYDRVCSRVVFFPQISHLCVRVRLSFSLPRARSHWCLRHTGQASAPGHMITRGAPARAHRDPMP
jgi:hypothetical protein